MATENNELTLERRLRPLRLVTVIRAGDSAELRKAIQFNSMQWGGLYNFIIPVRGRGKSVPKYSRRAADEVLREIEPDFVVTGKVDHRRLGVGDERQLSISSPPETRSFTVGTDIIPVLQWRYDQELKYQLRHPLRVRHCELKGPLSLFVSACFGEAPSQRKKPIAHAIESLGGTVVKPNAGNFAESFTECATLLTLGSSEVECLRGRRTAYFLLDGRNLGDISDFWNLRAMGWRVFPIPIQWASELSPKVATWIREHHAPSPPLREVVTRALVVGSDSIDGAELDRFVKWLSAPTENLTVCRGAPLVGDISPLNDLSPPQLMTKEDVTTASGDTASITIRGLFPPFQGAPLVSRYACATVVTLKGWEEPHLASVFPKGVREPEKMLGELGTRGARLVHSEGITVLGSSQHETFQVKRPTGTRLFHAWLAPRWDVKLSPAGKVVERMVLMMGGFWQRRFWTTPPIVKLFEDINRRPSRCMRHDVFLQRLRKEFGNKEVGDRIFEQWMRRRIIGLGLQIECAHCGQSNWLAATHVEHKVECKRCLESFDFPSLEPKKLAPWAVRPLGPFSIETFAQGSFAAAATIGFLLHELAPHGEGTWAPSLTIEGVGEALEVDFMVLRPGFLERTPSPVLFLGECKTFGTFEPKDISRMRQLRKAFPDAVLVLAKLSNEFSSIEKARLKKFVRTSGGKRDRGVLLLTARELGAEFGLINTWQRGTSKEQKNAKSLSPIDSDLLDVCEVSTRLHLDE